MFGGLRRLFGGGAESKSVAKSRLHFVLVQDRTGLSNEEMLRFKREMVEVIERYFVIDKDAFDVKYERESESTVLVINSPVIARRADSVENKKANKEKRKHAGNMRAEAASS